MDLLRLALEQVALAQARGHCAPHDASQPGGKYFWFD